MFREDLFIPNNFLALPSEYADFERARVVIVPVPYDSTTSYQAGARLGPRAIVEASRHLELYDEEEGTEPYHVGIHTLPELEPVLPSPEAMAARVEEVVGELLDREKFVVVLGGEHSISIGAVSAFSKRFPELSVLQIDAHADLRDSYCGTRYNHASTMRRILDRVPAVQVGIRSLSREEADLIRQRNLPVYFSKDLADTNEWEEEAISRLGQNVYITIDVDAFDPAIMPATGTPEPGGLWWPQVIHFLRSVTLRRKVVGFDVTELAPLAGQTAPDFLVAKLIYRLIGFVLSSSPKQ
ncbi:MAG TPA: agmatinase [bacterium]|nr:agmatinase [bacterium]